MLLAAWELARLEEEKEEEEEEGKEEGGKGSGKRCKQFAENAAVIHATTSAGLVKSNGRKKEGN